ncbi:hypothetical protein Sulac_2222 [Sulfobacillus acidophilus DSM 10332]|uniref:Uncharacterized protein n=1 Tax=Sulfobacillus acidophilus (strain ATCC 700253 / DSM 10332 / NAL) TaxID=679936 RepID=G8TTN1_SULAD|nr:hypothetical protein Sulac_2222 [Sulfobacillus acidophilus DSM 10332]
MTVILLRYPSILGQAWGRAWRITRAELSRR